MSATSTAVTVADSSSENRLSSSQRLLQKALEQKQAKSSESSSWVSNIQRIGTKSHTYVCFAGGRLKTFTTDKEDLNTTVALLFGHLNGLATRGAVAAGLAAVLTQSLLAPAFALDPNALQTGYQSVSGNHTFTQTGNVLDVSTGATRSIVNYQTFNVGSNATVNFNLPSASSSILNRVVSGQLSQIYGNINSNGQVFLVNPGGIVFGGSSIINVGGLVASTLSINNVDFLAGRYNFFRSATDAMSKITVENGAQLNAAQGGSLSLLATQIAQAGALSAPGGAINIGVGDRITLGDDLIGLTVTEGVKEAVEGASVLNSGTLSAQRVQIVADGVKNALMDAI